MRTETWRSRSRGAPASLALGYAPAEPHQTAAEPDSVQLRPPVRRNEDTVASGRCPESMSSTPVLSSRAVAIPSRTCTSYVGEALPVLVEIDESRSDHQADSVDGAFPFIGRSLTAPTPPATDSTSCTVQSGIGVDHATVANHDVEADLRLQCRRPRKGTGCDSVHGPDNGTARHVPNDRCRSRCGPRKGADAALFDCRFGHALAVRPTVLQEVAGSAFRRGLRTATDTTPHGILLHGRPRLVRPPPRSMHQAPRCREGRAYGRTTVARRAGIRVLVT